MRFSSHAAIGMPAGLGAKRSPTCGAQVHPPVENTFSDWVAWSCARLYPVAVRSALCSLKSALSCLRSWMTAMRCPALAGGASVSAVACNSTAEACSAAGSAAKHATPLVSSLHSPGPSPLCLAPAGTTPLSVPVHICADGQGLCADLCGLPNQRLRHPGVWGVWRVCEGG